MKLNIYESLTDLVANHGIEKVLKTLAKVSIEIGSDADELEDMEEWNNISEELETLADSIDLSADD